MRQPAVVLAVALAAILAAAGCGGGREQRARRDDRGRDGEELPVRPEDDPDRCGRTVTWTNEDNFTHTVQVDGQEDHKVERGESVSVAFDEPGTYHYVCTLHSQDMEGEVIVR